LDVSLWQPHSRWHKPAVAALVVVAQVVQAARVLAVELVREPAQAQELVGLEQVEALPVRAAREFPEPAQSAPGHRVLAQVAAWEVLEQASERVPQAPQPGTILPTAFMEQAPAEPVIVLAA